ncbi:uncharacterized protein LOC126614449 [Malus sylvestris]|uniref:uncharacterized protein LOC126614449 n=1 Tax=Malus sylvestris TaxID=3752 RepID=UPI0021ACA1DA|nr:uncharacterized protein LOC126614449 [Malus sylvestris]
MENPVMTSQPKDELSWIWNTKEIRRPDNSLDRKYYWNKIFIVLCLFAVLTDPLFLYIPILKDDIKCLMLDPKLKIVVLLLRSFTDLFYLMDIIIRIYRSKNSSVVVNLNRRQHQTNFSFVLKSCVPTIVKTTCVSNDILIDIVALLPLPQVAILIFFSKMSDLRSLTRTRMVLMNIFALLQYVPRVLRIYLLSKELKNRPLKQEITETPIWIKGVLNFCMYIIASHVVGALWYFFAIQRMMICWHSACRKDDGCDKRIFGCHDHHFFRNTTILNGLCPVSVSDNSSDTIFFDFGIFATVLKYGVVGSTNYFQKFLNCFWWGLRNLSSLGSNLEPSVDGWENLYTVFISVTGLLLFLYLIGNLQMYMQFETTRREDNKRKMQIKQKMEEKYPEIELWLFKNGIPTRLIKDMKLRIMEKLQATLEMSMDTNLDNIFPLLPSDVQSRIKEPMAWLKQVPMLRRMDEGLLKIIYQQLEPVRYTENENNLIIEKGEPLDKMVYIVDGFVSIEERSSDNSRRGVGELCGQELLRWPFYSDFPCREPLSTESVKAIGVVEALALNARDLKSIYMQSNIFEKEKSRHKRMMKEEMKRNIDGLMRKNGIPERLNHNVKLQIMKELFQEDKDVHWNILDWDYLVSLLPSNLQSRIKDCMPLPKLKQVPMLGEMDEGLLKRIYEQLEPVRYIENNLIIEKGEPLDNMIYIVDGFVSIEERSSDNSRRGVGELCGQELLRWPFYSDFPRREPLATESVKAIGVVEALALNARDLKSIYIKSDIFEKEKSRHKRMMKEEIERNIDELLCRNGIPERLNHDVKLRIMKELFQEDKDVHWNILDWDYLVSLLPSDLQSLIKDCMRLPKLKQVSMLGEMDEGLLKRIYEQLEPVRYIENSLIIEKGEPLDKMVYIVDGFVSIEERSSDDSRRGAGELFGQELLRWPFYSDFPFTRPLATESVKAIGVVEALALKARDLESTYSQLDIFEKEKPRHRRMMEEEMELNIDGLMRRNGIPKRLNDDIKLRIMKALFRVDKDVHWNILDWDYLVSLLPSDLQSLIKDCMPLPKLKLVPMLRGMDEGLLKIIYEQLEPVRYTDNSLIIEKGEPLDKMVYIVDGFVSIEERSSDNSRRGVGELCGQELLRWPFYSDFPYREPLATESVKAIGVVEALALNARDLKSVSS